MACDLQRSLTELEDVPGYMNISGKNEKNMILSGGILVPLSKYFD